jgi:CubicO group peptidase (beta-lactamase class C family)
MKRQLLSCVAALVFSLVSSGPAGATEHETEIAGLSEIVRKHLPENEKGALALLVTRDQRVVHCKGYGFIDKDTPMTPETRLSLASVAKQFTAMCAAILIENGKLKLTERVSQHLPDLRLKIDGRELLVQDLVWHISGLPNCSDRAERATIREFRKRRGIKYFTNQTHAEWLETQPPRRAPGLQYQYTNSGYALLARVVEAVSGKTYRAFQHEHILSRLDMADTEPVAALNGSGNMETTLEDYLKWDRALWNETLLNSRTSELIFKPGRLDNGEPVGYGFGWVLDLAQERSGIAYHTGGGSLKGNARNLVLRDLTNEITIAFFIRDNLKFTRERRHQMKDELHKFVLDMKE